MLLTKNQNSCLAKTESKRERRTTCNNFFDYISISFFFIIIKNKQLILNSQYLLRRSTQISHHTNLIVIRQSNLKHLLIIFSLFIQSLIPYFSHTLLQINLHRHIVTSFEETIFFIHLCNLPMFILFAIHTLKHFVRSNHGPIPFEHAAIVL